MPVEKRSSHKESHGGRKQDAAPGQAVRHIVEEVVHPFGRPPSDQPGQALTVDLVLRGRAGRRLRNRHGPQARKGRAAQPALGTA